jgi:peptidoglycan/xylan/chitin deacetylase (PgdA/CDA1 family)
VNAVRVVVFSSSAPHLAWRLAQRIEQEVPAATVCGFLYRPPRAPRSPKRALARLAGTALRWMHGCPRRGRSQGVFSTADLAARCREAGWPLLVVRDPHSRAAHLFVRRLEADLGVAGLGPTLPASLLRVPRCGSLVAQRRSRPPCGAEPGVETVSVERTPAGTVSRSLARTREPYDTALALELKTDLIAHDLLMASLAQPSLGEAGQGPTGPTSTGLPDPATPGVSARAGASAQAWPARTAPPLWKMGLCAVALSPFLIARNLLRRRQGRHPVIVLFHHLAADRPHHLAMPTDTFFHSVRFLQQHYRVLGLTEAMQALATGRVEAPSVVLTLDDGYRENFLTVRAVMEATGVPLTLFVNPDLIEERRPCPHDVRRGQDEFLPLTWEELAFLARSGAEIGSHTGSHFDCGSTDRARLEREIVGARDALERRLGRAVSAFAFPWGQAENMSLEAVGIARGAYTHVFSAEGGQSRPDRSLPAVLPRTFQCHDLWELELTLQSVFDLAARVRRAARRRPSRPRPVVAAVAGRPGHSTP